MCHTSSANAGGKNESSIEVSTASEISEDLQDEFWNNINKWYSKSFCTQKLYHGLAFFLLVR